MREAICECNVYICLNCDTIDGVYHGSNNCIGREIKVDYCKYCGEEK